jgi:hypothetical protein
LRARGRNPMVEIMIPLVVDVSELKLARSWVAQVEAEARPDSWGLPAVRVGTMIETPRAALVAADLAAVADFFSFGTNDLTQLTFAFSRDDAEVELIPRYAGLGLLSANPFEALDTVGVGHLIRYAINTARVVKPLLTIGACGEQAANPASLRFLVASGTDYVSCSPYQLPQVRVAIAQALLQLGMAKGDELAAACTLASQTRILAPIVGSDASPDTPFRVLHALRIKGFATTELVADVSGVDRGLAADYLNRFREEELVGFDQARGLWRLTAAGEQYHAAQLPGTSQEGLDRLRTAYDRFLGLNVAFKELCTSWQVRDGALNDHSDKTYDAKLVNALAEHHQAAEAVLAALADGLERLRPYRVLLQQAVGRVQSGDVGAFTGVMNRSYHDIWMELHEDLRLLLSIDRASEGSF